MRGLQLPSALGPAGAEGVVDGVANLPPRIFQRERRPVLRSREGPRQGKRAGLHQSQPRRSASAPVGDPRIAPAVVVVPSAAHERDASGPILHKRVERLGRLPREHVEAVAHL
jgi:hypothetical protein